MSQVRVTILECRSLPTGYRGYTDPYCTVQCRGKVFQTEIMPRNTSPMWNATFEFHNVDLMSDKLVFSVFDYDVVTVLVGEATFLCNRLMTYPRTDEWMPLTSPQDPFAYVYPALHIKIDSYPETPEQFGYLNSPVPMSFPQPSIPLGFSSPNPIVSPTVTPSPQIGLAPPVDLSGPTYSSHSPIPSPGIGLAPPNFIQPSSHTIGLSPPSNISYSQPFGLQPPQIPQPMDPYTGVPSTYEYGIPLNGNQIPITPIHGNHGHAAGHTVPIHSNGQHGHGSHGQSHGSGSHGDVYGYPPSNPNAHNGGMEDAATKLAKWFGELGAATVEEMMHGKKKK